VTTTGRTDPEDGLNIVNVPSSQKCPVDHLAPSRRFQVPRHRAPHGVPVYRADIYSREAILDPYPHYRVLRELGPVVWLERQRLYALPRHAEVKHVLSQDLTYRSETGVALNPVSGWVARHGTLLSDGDTHEVRRKAIGKPLTPRALRSMQPDVEELAERTVQAAVDKGTVDGVADIALALPMTVVPDLVGWPERGRPNLVKWAGATFDGLGPMNRQWWRSQPTQVRMLAFVLSLIRRRDVLPDSLGAAVLAALDDGQMTRNECAALIIDYLAPSIDTTASAIASALWLLATHPDQWRLLQDDPSLVPGAVQEVVRLESPLRAFGRRAHVPTAIAGTRVPAGARLLVMYASANRDERVFQDPDRFDVTRDSSSHVAFGHGVHGCAGQGLARMETQAVLRALLRQVDRIELTGRPELELNNVIHRFDTLPVRLVPRSAS
jgi:cytochrome P450